MRRPDLRRRIALVERNLSACTLCPWLCAVDRNRGEQGYCRLGSEARVFHHYLSFSEELEISPTYEVLVSGCSHRCRFCSVLNHVEDPGKGEAASVAALSEGIALAARKGLKTVSFVGGEPTVNLLGILRLIEALDPPYPIVWNSNMFMTPFVHDVLEGVVDVFVGDVHWGNDVCAREVGRVAPYFAPVTESLERASGYADLVVRHLLLPGHEACCFKPIAAWMRERLPKARFHVMGNFWPNGREAEGPFASPLTAAEARRALSFARGLGLALVPE